MILSVLIKSVPKDTCRFPDQVDPIKQKLNQTNQGGEIIKLADHDVIFNENESVILVGDRKCELPFSGNEFYLAKVLFSKQPRCPIDWSYVSKEMTGIDPLESRKNQKKLKRSVYDAVLAINDRIKKNIGTTDDLFTFKAKTVTRNY